MAVGSGSCAASGVGFVIGVRVPPERSRCVLSALIRARRGGPVAWAGTQAGTPPVSDGEFATPTAVASKVIRGAMVMPRLATQASFAPMRRLPSLVGAGAPPVRSTARTGEWILRVSYRCMLLSELEQSEVRLPAQSRRLVLLLMAGALGGFIASAFPFAVIWASALLGIGLLALVAGFSALWSP